MKSDCEQTAYKNTDIVVIGKGRFKKLRISIAMFLRLWTGVEISGREISVAENWS